MVQELRTDQASWPLAFESEHRRSCMRIAIETKKDFNIGVNKPERNCEKNEPSVEVAD